METLELIVDEGRPANAGRFFQLGVDLLTLLDELTDVPIKWRVDELRIGSAVARLASPETDEANARYLRLAVASLDAVSAGGGLSDTDWTPEAIKVAHRFVEHAQPTDENEDWVPPRLVLVQEPPAESPSVTLTEELAQRLADLQPFERRMPGSVRGTLVGFNVSRGNRASLRTPNGRIVRVAFDTGLRPDFKEAMLQPVELRGEVRQDDNGRIFHVRAQSVEVLLLPDVHWTDLFGIDPTFTGDVATDDYLEAHRGEA